VDEGVESNLERGRDRQGRDDDQVDKYLWVFEVDFCYCLWVFVDDWCLWDGLEEYRAGCWSEDFDLLLDRSQEKYF
jgi:hypothetical protein